MKRSATAAAAKAVKPSPDLFILRQCSSEFEASPGNFLLKTKTEHKPPSAFAGLKANEFNLTHVYSLLLPRNYEKSTLPSYVPYVKHTMLSAIFGTAASVISMQALLMSIGVGGGGVSSSTATVAASSVLPIAATVNWILKDGMGQLGGILFANRVNTSFDADPKRFRFAADAALGLGVVLESLTAVFPSSFLLIASGANVFKNVAWISASATRASIHQSFCLERNLADVTAKAGAQMTTASLLGTLVGISTSYALLVSPWHCFAASAAFTSLHLAFSYTALQQVQMNNLNVQRAWLCLVPAMLPHRNQHQSILCSLDFAEVATPQQVAKWERILHFGKWGGRDGKAQLVHPLAHIQQMKREATSSSTSPFSRMLPPKKFNSSLQVNASVEHNLNPDDLRLCLDLCNEFGDKHLVLVKPVLGARGNNQFNILLWFLHSAKSSDVVNGFLHAALVCKAMNRLDGGVEFHPDSKYHGTVRDVRVAMENEQAASRFSSALVTRGWDVNHVFIEEKRDNRIEIFANK